MTCTAMAPLLSSRSPPARPLLSPFEVAYRPRPPVTLTVVALSLVEVTRVESLESLL